MGSLQIDQVHEAVQTLVRKIIDSNDHVFSVPPYRGVILLWYTDLSILCLGLRGDCVK